MKAIHFWPLILTLVSLITPLLTEAKLVQILHTNDTHSYLDNSGNKLISGGAARLKSLIDFYRDQATNEGVNTLVLDAGDFLEGNMYYMADQGRKAFDVHNEMGYDVGTLGNHDYMMGTKEFDKILGETDLNYSMVVANLTTNPDFKNIREKISPYKEIVIDGFKIAVLGLTTNEIYYKWAFDGGFVSNPYKAAKKYEKILKEKDNDLIIALTHIGVLSDIKLAERSKYIDLIIGGHSHTALFKPSFGINLNKRKIPIVQAGMHTEYLGKILVDLEKGKPAKLVSYELVPVKYESFDPQVSAIVEEADVDLDNRYGKGWLNQVIGYSDLKSNDEDALRKWAYFITDAIKEKTNADIGIHTPLMSGEDYPVGDVTRRDLFNSIPRIFDLKDKFGWSIYTTKVKGVWLRLVFEALTHFGQPLTFSGLKMEYKKTEHGVKIKHLLVNGKVINPYRYYTVAFTEGIIRGAQGISPYTMAILRNPKNTEIKIWPTLEEKVGQSLRGFKKESLSKISEDNHQLIMPNRNAELIE